MFDLSWIRFIELFINLQQLENTVIKYLNSTACVLCVSGLPIIDTK